ncbi:hypothetical protein LY78DRAFT_332479 [Colletotrichum sublineola]|nr:hypothetical protein LY78DRAFT_332479 [Colletotrichum sublineola]
MRRCGLDTTQQPSVAHHHYHRCHHQHNWRDPYHQDQPKHVWPVSCSFTSRCRLLSDGLMIRTGRVGEPHTHTLTYTHTHTHTHTHTYTHTGNKRTRYRRPLVTDTRGNIRLFGDRNWSSATWRRIACILDGPRPRSSATLTNAKCPPVPSCLV